MTVHDTAAIFGIGLCYYWGHFLDWKPHMVALVDSPVSMVIMHVWFIGIRVHSGEIAG